MFVNKLYIKSKKYCNVKSSTYYFHIKTKILTDFQIYIRVLKFSDKIDDISGDLWFKVSRPIFTVLFLFVANS